MSDLLQNTKKNVFCTSTAKEISFECSYHRISYSESKVKITLYSIINNTTGNCVDQPQVDCVSAKGMSRNQIRALRKSRKYWDIKDLLQKKNHILRVPRMDSCNQIELTSMVCDFLVGNHNGSVDGVQYFSCPPSYGALVPVDEILCVTASNVSAFCSFMCPPKIFGVFYL